MVQLASFNIVYNYKKHLHFMLYDYLIDDNAKIYLFKLDDL